MRIVVVNELKGKRMRQICDNLNTAAATILEELSPACIAGVIIFLLLLLFMLCLMLVQVALLPLLVIAVVWQSVYRGDYSSNRFGVQTLRWFMLSCLLPAFVVCRLMENLTDV